MVRRNDFTALVQAHKARLAENETRVREVLAKIPNRPAFVRPVVASKAPAERLERERAEFRALEALPAVRKRP